MLMIIIMIIINMKIITFVIQIQGLRLKAWAVLHIVTYHSVAIGFQWDLL